MKKINWKNAGRKKSSYKKPRIINDYENLEDKVMTIPEIVKHDYGFEFHFGFECDSDLKERTFSRTKWTPLYRDYKRKQN
ncbi:MAG: hypothetical protein CL525_13800 [Aequorivita sp.]|nr:hypothetical protein [Aequorivita sp.]